MSDRIEKQNDTIIALLARSTIGIDGIYEIVRRGKQDPSAYIDAYNSLDGSVGVTEVAKIAKVKLPTMSMMLQSWEQQGIVYNIGNAKKSCYRGLLRLPKRLPKGEGLK